MDLCPKVLRLVYMFTSTLASSVPFTIGVEFDEDEVTADADTANVSEAALNPGGIVGMLIYISIVVFICNSIYIYNTHLYLYEHWHLYLFLQAFLSVTLLCNVIKILDNVSPKITTNV